MTKTKVICDICGKDMPLDVNSKGTKKIDFYMTFGGTQLDMCEECKLAIYKRVMHYSAKCQTPATDEMAEKNIMDKQWYELKRKLKVLSLNADNSIKKWSYRFVCAEMNKLEEEKRKELKEDLEESEVESEVK